MFEFVLHSICPFRWWVRPRTIPLNLIGPWISNLNKLVTINLSYLKNQTTSYWPGFIKSWQTKICGLEGRVLFCWFEKEILHKEMYKLFSGLVRNKLWNMIYQLLHELEGEHLQLVIQPLPQVSYHGAPNHVDGIQLQLWACLTTIAASFSL